MSSKLLRRLMEWRRDRKRRQKFARRLAACDVALLSLGKSGRTWLIAMIGHVLHRRFGTPADRLLKSDGFYDGAPAEVPRFFLSHLEPPYPLLDANGAPLPDLRRKRIILLVRDPRDMAVSFYFHYKNRASEKARATQRGDLPDYMLHENGGQVMRLVTRLNRWLEALGGLPDKLIVRYEDLRRDPADVLRQVCEFCGIKADEADIAAAVAFASFENLQRLEQQGFFKEEALQPGDPKNQDSFKVRRGKVGGYRDYLSPEQCDVVDGIVRDTLLPELGYR